MSQLEQLCAPSSRHRKSHHLFEVKDTDRNNLPSQISHLNRTCAAAKFALQRAVLALADHQHITHLLDLAARFLRQWRL